jgi:hypothetical protein
MRTGGQTWRRE